MNFWKFLLLFGLTLLLANSDDEEENSENNNSKNDQDDENDESGNYLLQKLFEFPFVNVSKII